MWGSSSNFYSSHSIVTANCTLFQRLTWRQGPCFFTIILCFYFFYFWCYSYIVLFLFIYLFILTLFYYAILVILAFWNFPHPPIFIPTTLFLYSCYILICGNISHAPLSLCINLDVPSQKYLLFFTFLKLIS